MHGQISQSSRYLIVTISEDLVNVRCSEELRTIWIDTSLWGVRIEEAVSFDHILLWVRLDHKPQRLTQLLVVVIVADLMNQVWGILDHIVHIIATVVKAWCAILNNQALKRNIKSVEVSKLMLGKAQSGELVAKFEHLNRLLRLYQSPWNQTLAIDVRPFYKPPRSFNLLLTLIFIHDLDDGPIRLFLQELHMVTFRIS